MLDQVLAEIERRERFVLTSHDRADGDAVGSSLACQQILHSMGKKAEVILRHGVPRVYQQLPFASTVLPTIVAFPCGGSASLSSVLGTMPARLLRHTESTMSNSPLALVPE